MRYLRVWDTDGGIAEVHEHEEPRIDAAVSQYLSSGRTHDTILDLTMISGAEYKILASCVTSWMLCTPETREANLRQELAMRDEEKTMRHALGMWDDE